MIKKIHAYLVKEVDLAENAEEKSAEFVNRVCQVTLEAFWTQNVKEKKALTGLTACWKGWEPDGTRPSCKILPIAFSIPDSRVPPSSRRSIDRGTTSPVRDFWSGELCEGTSNTAHRRNAYFAARGTFDANCDNARELRRIYESDPLPGADEREREEV